jgi:hypothetical protein
MESVPFLSSQGGSGRSSWKVSVRLVIGRSSVRIRPRAPKPQVRGHFWHCARRGGNRRSFLWLDHRAAGAPAPLRYVGVPPTSRLGRARTLDEGMSYETGSPRPVGGRSWAARFMRLRRHSLISTQGIHTLNKPDGPRAAPATLASYPPTVPAVRPRTKYRCSETNTSTGTAMVMIAPPVTTCQP